MHKILPSLESFILYYSLDIPPRYYDEPQYRLHKQTGLIQQIPIEAIPEKILIEGKIPFPNRIISESVFKYQLAYMQDRLLEVLRKSQLVV